jgi:hypothetical protein
VYTHCTTMASFSSAMASATRIHKLTNPVSSLRVTPFVAVNRGPFRAVKSVIVRAAEVEAEPEAESDNEPVGEAVAFEVEAKFNFAEAKKENYYQARLVK